jgi:hypothetical protein
LETLLLQQRRAVQRLLLRRQLLQLVLLGVLLLGCLHQPEDLLLHPWLNCCCRPHLLHSTAQHGTAHQTHMKVQAASPLSQRPP